MRPQILTQTELAEHLGVSARTLSRWHLLRKGPPRVQVGRLIAYRIEAVENWLQANEMHPVTGLRK